MCWLRPTAPPLSCITMNVINEEGNEVTLPAPLVFMEDGETTEMPGSKEGTFYTATRFVVYPRSSSDILVASSEGELTWAQILDYKLLL